ncbi:ROK family transcriptional regulator [Roseicyclus sp.]|uniref:ROK family transcriptional regulator n=1 Tax=Roseicyclus sp. TaxID=1914329 RepID=UPI003F9EC4B3
MMRATDHDPWTYLPTRFRRAPDVAEAVSGNERLVLSQVWRNAGLARSALGARLDLTQQSIHRIIAQLADRGLLILGDLEPPAYKGKPSPRLSINPRHACVAGISINTDSAGIAVMDFAGGVRTRSVPISDLTLREGLARVGDVIAALRAEAGFAAEDLFGIGFAISGFVIEGSRYNAPEPLSHWSDVQLGPLLSEHFGLPVWTENGANTGAICEQMLGVGREVDNFVYLSFNYGFGGGIILDGELARGAFGNAGELSGMFTPAEMPDRPALRSLLETLQANGVDVTTIYDLSRQFEITWPSVSDWLDRVEPYHNRVVNVLSAVVDPEVIVFGGQIPRALAEALIARTAFWDHPRHGIRRRMPRLQVSEIGGETSAIGAAAMALKKGFF